MDNDRYKTKQQCWAFLHGECEGELTKEHVVSQSILELFKPVKYELDGREPAFLGKGSFVLKRLCKRHNELLSPYDSEAFKLFKAIGSIYTHKLDSALFSFENGIYKCDISRKKIERWYAKTFFNYIYFMTIFEKPEKLPFMLNPHSILNKLYNDENFKPPFGLYLVHPEKPIMRNHNPFHIQAISNIDSRYISPQGIVSEYCKFPCFLYTRLLHVEIVGVFNITALSDANAIDVLGAQIESLKKIATQNFGGMGYVTKDKNNLECSFDILFKQ